LPNPYVHHLPSNNDLTANHARKIADPTPKPDAKAFRVPPVSKDAAPQIPSLPRVGETNDDPADKKRKRDPLDESDQKLSEYLEVFGGHASKRLRDGEVGADQADLMTPGVPPELEAGESDDEYEAIPRRPQVPPPQPTISAVAIEAPRSLPVPETAETTAEEVPQVPDGATDGDWLRTRTNRLLDLMDPEEAGIPIRAPAQPTPTSLPASSVVEQAAREAVDGAADMPEGEVGINKTSESPLSLVEKTRRLFLRNLSYTATEDNIREYFSTFGNLEEVRSTTILFFLHFVLVLHDEPPIGTSYATADDLNLGSRF